jgi:purine-binding chemotaxis protein CheW
MSDNRSGAATAAPVAKAGKYLTFQLGKEVYGIEILKVQEIIGMMTVTRVPKTPGFVRGVINLRGKVIPVIELRSKFGMEGREDTDRTCIVVVQVASASGTVTMGLLVDEVSEVLNVGQEQIEAPPTFGASVDTDFILGMGKVGQKVVMLLDADKVLSSDELVMATQNKSTDGKGI